MGDILDPAAVDAAMAGCEVVFHEAAIPSVARSVVDPASIERGQRDRHDRGDARGRARRASGGSSSPARRRSTASPERCRAGRPAARAAVAVRGQQARRGALRPHARPAARRRDRRPALLQRLRSGPGPDSEYAAVVPRSSTAALSGDAPDDLRRRRPVARLHLRRQRRRRRTSSPPPAGRRRGLTCNVACGGRFTLLSCSTRSQRPPGARLDSDFGPPRPGDILHSQADITLAARATWLRARSCRSTRGSPGPSPGTGSGRCRCSGTDRRDRARCRRPGEREPRASARAGLVASSLGAGGAERVMAILAGCLGRAGERRHDPDPRDAGRGDRPLPIDERVSICGSWASSPRRDRRRHDSGATGTRVRGCAGAMAEAGRPDVVISFMDRTNVLVARGDVGPPATRSWSPSTTTPTRNGRRRPGRLPGRHVPAGGARVVALTDRAARLLPAWRRRASAAVVPNPVVRPSRPDAVDRGRTPVPSGPGSVLAMGRLVHQKGFDLLLEAFARIAHARSARAGRSRSMGEGPERARPLQRSRAWDSTGRGGLPGVTADPGGACRGRDLFVLSSRWEGFPTVLGEAMAAGPPGRGVRLPQRTSRPHP